MGRFLSVDPESAGADPAFPQTWNAYAYVANNPLKYVDQNGEYLATAWSVANVAIGVASFASNIKQGNYVAATVDAVGVALDVAATTTGLPGGAGTALRVARAADKLATATGAARTAGKGGELLMDSSAIVSDGKRLLESGENVVKTNVSVPELRGAAANPDKRLGGVPNAASKFPTVPTTTNVNTKINVRGQLPPGPGRFGDGSIGGTAIDRGATLVVKDRDLADAVKKLGGKVVDPDDL